MRRIIFTLLISFSLKALSFSNLELLNGTWDCRYSSVSAEYGFVIDHRSLNSVDVTTLSYSSIAMEDVKVNNDSVLKLQTKLKGTFSFEGNVSTSVTTEAGIKVVSGSLPEKVVDEIKQNILNEETLIKTISIDEKEWVIEDLDGSNETVCKKI